MTYDYLIVGAGFFGAVFAREAAERGYRCLVVDRRAHIGGNAYCESLEGISVHVYGPHIFHTASRRVWEYVNRFAEFNRFVLSPLARYKDELYNLPFNMNTFSKLWGVATPAEARAKLAEQTARHRNAAPRSLEEQALSMVGDDIYEKLIKGYTEKQWGRPCAELPASVIRRLPLRFTYDNNYFNDPYQGIPIGGYNPIFEKLLAGAEVRLNTDYFALPESEKSPARATVFSGRLDEFFGYRLGSLEYRGLRFETETLDTDNYQGAAVVNYTERDVLFTRCVEHKHFEFGTQPKTVVTREYPLEWQPGAEPFYPINDERNDALCGEYKRLAEARGDVIFGGRLGSYKYLDMDKVIESALNVAETVL
jgi:UDP-galactopyranose mutase